MRRRKQIPVPLGSTGRTAKQLAAIRRYFRGMPVVEATENLRVFVSERDKKRAIRKDPAHCVYANACRRLYGSSAVLFFRSIAYVDLPDEDGNRVVNRFVLRAPVRQQIITFDRTGKSADGGFLLSAPSKRTETLAAKTRTQKAYLKRRAKGIPISKRHRKAYLKGQLVIAAMGTDIRSGRGHVHFISGRNT